MIKAFPLFFALTAVLIGSNSVGHAQPMYGSIIRTDYLQKNGAYPQGHFPVTDISILCVREEDGFCEEFQFLMKEHEHNSNLDRKLLTRTNDFECIRKAVTGSLGRKYALAFLATTGWFLKPAEEAGWDDLSTKEGSMAALGMTVGVAADIVKSPFVAVGALGHYLLKAPFNKRGDRRLLETLFDKKYAGKVIVIDNDKFENLELGIVLYKGYDSQKHECVFAE